MFGHWLLSFAAVVMLSLGSIDGLSIKEKSSIKKAMHPFLTECLEIFGYTEEQVERGKKMRSTYIDACFLSCLFKKAKFFDSKGMFDVETTDSFIKSHVKSEGALMIFGLINTTCAKVNNEDVSDGDEGCDRAKLLYDCVVGIKQEADIDY